MSWDLRNVALKMGSEEGRKELLDFGALARLSQIHICESKEQSKYAKHNEGNELGAPEMMLGRGLVRFVPAVAYHSCLNLPPTFSQPRRSVVISGPVEEGISLYPTLP